MTESDQASTTASPVVPAYIPSNPWRIALIAIWFVTVLVGVILVIAGAGIIGGALIAIGIVALIVWVGAELVLWTPGGGYVSRVDRDSRPQSE
jgi:hypothetical protein